jgi:APA family basic amino acid/polyamine antiporter
MQDNKEEFKRELGLMDGTMLVVGSMIGSGIFIAQTIRFSRMAHRHVGSWDDYGDRCVSYGELSAMFPKAGGQYIY